MAVRGMMAGVCGMQLGVNGTELLVYPLTAWPPLEVPRITSDPLNAEQWWPDTALVSRSNPGSHAVFEGALLVLVPLSPSPFSQLQQNPVIFEIPECIRINWVQHKYKSNCPKRRRNSEPRTLLSALLS